MAFEKRVFALSCRLLVLPVSGGPYYYRIICRTGTLSGSGTIIYDTESVEGSYIYLTGGSFQRTIPVNPETTYTVNVLYYFANSASTYVGAMGGQEFTTPRARPDDWAWISAVAQGASVPTSRTGTNTYKATYLTAAEWNSFVDRIKAFEYYLTGSVGNYASLYVTAGNTMLASTIENARAKIAALNPPIMVPDSTGSGNLITAAYINGLMWALNSIV